MCNVAEAVVAGLAGVAGWSCSSGSCHDGWRCSRIFCSVARITDVADVIVDGAAALAAFT